MKQIDYNNTILNIPNRYVNDNLLSRFKRNSYEKDELSLIEYIDKNDNVLELGSCLGYLSVLVSKKCNNIVSIEANPELNDALYHTKIDNKCANLIFINSLIDKEIKIKEFYTYNCIVAGSADRDDKNNPDYNNKWNKNIKKYEIKTENIVNIEKKYDIKFNTLLIDIEGGELIFFNQFKDFIANNIKKIIVELHGRLMKDKMFNNKCINLLKEIGFTVKKKSNGSYFFSK